MVQDGRKVKYSLNAAFVIERRVGQGYCITSADGPKAKDLEIQALRLLDDIGQPNPNGPEICHVLLGSIARSSEFVAATITVTPAGETTYRQWWYRPLHVPRFRHLAFSLIYATCLVAAGCVFGVLGARHLFESQVLQKPTEQAIQVTPKPLVAEPPSRLHESIVASRDVRTKLRKYLSLEGFAAPKGEVVQVKPAIMLNSMLVPNVIPKEMQREDLDNVEVRAVLDLLFALDDWNELPAGSGKGL